MWNNLSTANMWKTILLTYDKAIHFIKLRTIFVLAVYFTFKSASCRKSLHSSTRKFSQGHSLWF